jgi:hypothetical protein
LAPHQLDQRPVYVCNAFFLQETVLKPVPRHLIGCSGTLPATSLGTNRRSIVRYFIALALAIALAVGPAVFAGSTDWGNASNGYGYYHESNG